MEPICTILSIIVGVVVFAVVGHYLWLFFAAILRILFGNQDSAVDSHRQTKSGGRLESRIASDLEAARRLVDYAQYNGWLPADQLTTLRQLIQNYSKRAFGDESETKHQQTDSSPSSIPHPSTTATPPSDALSSKPAVDTSSIAQPVSQLPLVVPVHPLDEPEPVSSPQVMQPGTTRTHPLSETSSVASSEPTVSRPRAALSASLMRAFMEKSNIRWIELISASLIVVCSVGLVISLWSTLSATSRYFPSLVFLVATAAVHAAGQYTLRKWNLRSTSRGILHIGLMLIPLAVLVGILLSDREGQLPQLDLMTIVVIAVGTIVYGGAAVTACRALFGGRYLPVASTVVIGALSLVPIHFLGAESRLGHPLSVAALLPLLGIGLINALLLSHSSRRQLSFSSGRSIRTATQVLQLLFASAVPAYFWLMKSGGYSSLSDLALSTAGLWLAGWASWGWTASRIRFMSFQKSSNGKRGGAPTPSFNSLHTAPVRKQSKGSWLNVVALGLALVCSLALAAILWQMSSSRWMFAGLLSALCLWWLCHGWRCRILVSQAAGALAGTLAIGLFVEWLVPNAPQQLRTTDWFTFSRIISLNASSLVCGLAGAFVLFLRPSTNDNSRSTSSAQPLEEGANNQFAVALLAGGGLVLVGTTILTTLASLVPWSSPAYGGNWAPLLLLLNGAVLMIAGTVGAITAPAKNADSGNPHNPLAWISYLFPIAQGFMLLGAIRLCQSAPIVPEWIAELRPFRSWSTGTGTIALIWSGVAAVLRVLPGRTSNNRSDSVFLFAIHSLSFGSVIVALVSVLAYFRLSDQLTLLSSLGWMLPITFGLLFLAVRESSYREFTVVFSAGWVASLLIRLGWTRQWWETLGVSATVSILVLSTLAVLLISRFLFRDSEEDEKWLFRGSRWSLGLLLRCCWTVWLASLMVPVSIQYWNSLAPVASMAEPTNFLWIPLDFVRSALVLLTAVVLGGVTFWPKNSQSDTIRLWLASLPIVLASLIGCVTPVPYSVPAFLITLAATMIGMELLSLTRTAWGQRLYGVSQSLSRGQLPETSDNWLAFTMTSGIAVLVLGTSSVLLSQLVGRIPEPVSALVVNMSTWSGWIGNLGRTSPWLGPLVALLAVRWLIGMWTAAPARAITRRGYALGVTLTVASTLAGAATLEQALLFGLQGFTLIMVVLSWKTLSFTAARNFLGLRQLDKKSSFLQLLSKARGGARWRQAEQAAWNIWTAGTVAATLLSLTAALLVALYPTRAFSALHPLGNLWTILSVALAIALWWLLGLQRGMSKFGLMAVTLGLMGPMLAASYASWLMNNPSAKIASVADFEPYRMLVGIWLVSLLCGLIIRILSNQRRSQMSTWAETTWIGLAASVGLLAILGLPIDSRWASGQLTILAIIIAISSEASGKTWRGWIAAIAGILAWTPWMFNGGRSDWLFYPWQVLWGCTGVGLICLATRFVFQKFGLAANPAQAAQAVQAALTPQVRPRWSIDRATCLLVSGLSVALSGVWILFQSNTVSTPVFATWIVVGLVAGNLILAVARLWDSGPSQRGLSVYLAVVSTTVVFVNLASSWWELPRIQAELAWFCGLLGALTLMATLLREMSLQRLPVQRYFGWSNLVTDDKLRRARDGMAVGHTIAALVCLLPSVWLVLTIPNAASRLAAIALPMLGAAAILPVSMEARRSFQRGSVLLLASATLILAWWADLPAAWSVREENQSWLFVHRSFLACIVLATVYPLIAWRRSLRYTTSPASSTNSIQSLMPEKPDSQSSDVWTPSLIIGGWVCLGIAVLVGFGMIIGTMTGHWSDFPARVGLGVKCFTLVGWGLVFARLIQSAARPLSIERLADSFSRTVMVYTAEITLVLGGIAAYQHFPNLFSGVFLPWWPLVVFGIAFASAGIGQLLQRASKPILADPIHQSSLLLPLIPLAGVWWVQKDSAAAHWGEWGSYWLLLAAASGLYGLYGWIRSSVWLRAISTGVALLSFWALLLSRPDLQFFDRPQVWLLPPAVGALLFVEWNRKKLDATTVTVSRYVCILIAYLSSSAEVFLKAIEGNLWQPLLLLFLSLCGAIAGMLLRIRAFLYCGVTFIMVALFGMVWHAAQAIDQVWPWWVFGIATGVGLIVLLGYFEKNRSKVLKYLEELKSWQQ